MNFQQVNWLIDTVMPAVKPAPFKIITLVCRLTWGWDKEAVIIKTAEFEALTGMTKPTVITAIQEAVEKGWIIREADGQNFQYSPNWLNNLTGKESLPVKKFNQSGKEILPEAVKEFNRFNGIYNNNNLCIDPKEEKEKKERKKAVKKFNHPVWEMSKELKTAEFEQAWMDWYRHRLEKDDPLTQTAGDYELSCLLEMGHDRAIAAIKHSIRRGWKSIHEESTNGSAPKNNNQGWHPT